MIIAVAIETSRQNLRRDRKDTNAATGTNRCQRRKKKPSGERWERKNVIPSPIILLPRVSSRRDQVVAWMDERLVSAMIRQPGLFVG